MAKKKAARKATRPKVHKLDAEATQAFDQWKKLQKRANDSNKGAQRSKDQFVAAFGDREKVQLADGRIIRRVREDRDGYKVPPKTRTTYVVEADE